MAGNHAVSCFRERGDGRDVFVRPRHPSLALDRIQRAEHGVSATQHLAVRHDEFDGRCEVFQGNIGNVWANFLVGRVEHSVTREAFAILDPGATKWTLSVEDEERSINRAFIHIGR